MAGTIEAEAPARTRAGSAATRRSAFTPGKVMLYLVLILIALFFILPLVWMLSTSLKVESDTFG